MKSDYNKLCEHLSNFNQFSRIFGIAINKKKTDALVPFADLLNHKRPK